MIAIVSDHTTSPLVWRNYLATQVDSMATRTYGSEYHLFRYRRLLAEQLDTAIQNAIGVTAPLQWVYPADPAHPGSEPEGLGFIPEARPDWRTFWTQRGSQQCWDGVATINEVGRTPTWLLMEAKATTLSLRAHPAEHEPAARPVS